MRRNAVASGPRRRSRQRVLHQNSMVVTQGEYPLFLCADFGLIRFGRLRFWFPGTLVKGKVHILASLCISIQSRYILCCPRCPLERERALSPGPDA